MDRSVGKLALGRGGEVAGKYPVDVLAGEAQGGNHPVDVGNEAVHDGFRNPGCLGGGSIQQPLARSDQQSALPGMEEVGVSLPFAYGKTQGVVAESRLVKQDVPQHQRLRHQVGVIPVKAARQFAGPGTGGVDNQGGQIAVGLLLVRIHGIHTHNTPLFQDQTGNLPVGAEDRSQAAGHLGQFNEDPLVVHDAPVEPQG